MSLKAVFAGAKSGASILSEKFDDLMFITLKVAAIGVACVAVYKYSGIRAAGDDLAWWMMFGLGLCAVGFEYYGAQTLVDGWYDRAFGGVVFGAALCVPALALSYSNAISSAAVQQSTAAGMQKAAFRKTVNSETAVKEAEFALQAAMDARSKLTPKRSAADARAAIDSAQAHRWWANTEKCTEAKGPQRQAFCNDYRSAVADLALWDDISREDARIANLKAKTDEARATEAEAPAAVSEVRADTLEYASLFGTDAQGGQSIQAKHIALTITLFVTLTGFLTAWKRNQGREVRPWGFVTWARRKWHVLWNGSEEGFDAGKRIINNVTIADDARLDRLAERMVQNRQVFA